MATAVPEHCRFLTCKGPAQHVSSAVRAVANTMSCQRPFGHGPNLIPCSISGHMVPGRICSVMTLLQPKPVDTQACLQHTLERDLQRS